MNNYLTAFESYVVTNPLRAITIFAAIIAVVFYALKKWVLDDLSDLDAGKYDPEREKQVKRAANRLD
jgi:hypothetical protein